MMDLKINYYLHLVNKVRLIINIECKKEAVLKESLFFMLNKTLAKKTFVMAKNKKRMSISTYARWKIRY